MHLALLLVLQAAPVASPIDLCEVAVATRADVARLFDVAQDPDDHDRADDGWVRVHADAAEQERLVRAGFTLRVLQKDLARHYAERAAAQSAFRVRIATAEQAGQTTPATQGLLYLAGTETDLATGTTGANGRAVVSWTVASGSPAYLQVLVDEGGAQAAWSNLLRVNAP